jgi:membrane protein YdbS with pleckstrin-like domain
MKQNVNRYQNRRPAEKSSKAAFSWQSILTPRRQRTLIVLFLASFVFSLILELYTFGFPDGFFGRWFSAIMVLFLFFSITIMGIIPLVKYISNRWLRF